MGMIVHRAQAVLSLGAKAIEAARVDGGEALPDRDKLLRLVDYVDGIARGLTQREHATVDRLARALGIALSDVAAEADRIEAGWRRGIASAESYMATGCDATTPAYKRTRTCLGTPRDRCEDLDHTTTPAPASPPMGRQVHYCG